MGVFADIKSDFLNAYRNDPALSSKFELFFNYPGVWSLAWYRVAHKLYNANFKRVARIIMGLNQIVTNIDIHPASTIGRRVFIDHGFGVVIGETAIVEDDVLIYQGVTLGGVSLTSGKRHPTIKKNSVIGSGAKVLGNITIGNNCKIGANSVVVKDVPSNSTAVGVPAKIIKRKVEDNTISSQFDHNNLPDVSKQMFNYLLKRVAVLEYALKTYDGIDVSNEDKELEEVYANLIEAMKQE